MAGIRGTALPRPMTEQLVGTFLAECGLTCREVVVGPADSSGHHAARMHLAAGGTDAWFEADPIDAFGVAFAVTRNPCTWCTEAP